MTIEEFYKAMKNMEFEQFKRLDCDQKEYWHQLYESLKADFDTKEKA